MTALTRLSAARGTLLAGVMIGAACAVPTAAEAPQSLMEYIEAQILPRLDNADLLTAIHAQNAETSEFSDAEIERLDQLWRQQVGTEDAHLIATVTDNPLAAELRAWRDASNDLIHEIFVMDRVGLNVAAAAPTSDYWQGDEPEHADAIANGLYVGPLEFDESVQRYQVEAAVPIRDPETGQIIGALAVGLDPSVMLE